MTLDELLSRLPGPSRRRRQGATTQCPAHDDTDPSLDIDERDGLLLVKCRAGCAQGVVLAALGRYGIRASDLRVNGGQPPAHARAAEPVVTSEATRVYDYTDAAGRLLFQVVITRYFPKGSRRKTVRQRRPNPAGDGWLYELGETPRVLYRLPELTEQRTVFFPEGEECANDVWGLGLAATTAPGGTGGWDKHAATLTAQLAALGPDLVVVLADNDPSGLTLAAKKLSALHACGVPVKLVELPGLPDGGDVSDWINAGGTQAALLERTDAAPLWTPPASPAPDATGDVHAAGERAGAPWPMLNPAARHGLAGEFVDLTEQHTEADPAGLLLQFLAGAGNMLGRGPHWAVEADEHHSNIFVVLVGVTSKGRKGVSLGHVKRRLRTVDEMWASKCIVGGLSSGEGLIHEVRDPVFGEEKDGTPTVIDEGVSDKRRLVVETEFSSPLKMAKREGNILSGIVRQAWDTGTLHTLTKHSPSKATGAHISVIAHITQDELVRHLDETEMANGFANRFLWGCVKRSHVLPEGGQISGVNFEPFTLRLNAAVTFATEMGDKALTFDAAARERWHAKYPRLSEGRPGMFGAVTGRAEAQVARLALIYALLACAREIKLPHLEAALAVWGYCQASAAFIFGDALGDPVADQILAALRDRPEGMTRNDVRNFFGRHLAADQIDRALVVLAKHGRARCEFRRGLGRPAEVWKTL